MSIARSVADVLRDHVVLELEAIDRMYLNVYVPHLQTVGAVVGYLYVHYGQRFAPTSAVVPMTEAFIRKIGQFVNDEGVDLVAFEKDQRNDNVTLVNHYYFYCVDENFGPFFLKFCSYFPYTAKLCINGHEYLKRQLAKWGVASR
jgi:hypothetical protein